jgi:circadian clock protein KaiB
MSKNTDTDPPPIEDAMEALELALQDRNLEHYSLKLYVSGMSPKSQRAIDNARKICEEHLHGRFDLEIIDIYQQPIFAKEGQIIAAPTLVKELPKPLRKFIGDLSKTDQILAGLNLTRKK